MLTSKRKRKKVNEARRADFFARLLVLLQVTCASYLFGKDMLSTFHGQWKFTQLLGAIIFIPSIVLWLIARIQLGRSCTLLPIAEQLVTRGIYSKFRNPVYLFGSLTIIGYFLFYDHPEGLLCMLLVIPIQYVRAYKESIALENRFGQLYQEYAKHTWI